MQHHGLGWGGDDDVPCTWQHVGCYATSWVGVWWGWWRSVHLTTCWMLCNIMGWGGVGMMTFRALDNMYQHVGCYAKSLVGVGWGWWRSVHLTTCWMLRNIMGWGGVGMMTFRALDNMLDAMQHHGLGWGGDDDVPCTWQHVGCYATSWVGVGVGMMTFHALDNVLDATQHHGLGWGGDDDVPCTWQHGMGMMTFRALDNMLDATQHHGLGWGGDDDLPCAWQHVGCYATSWVGVGWGWWRSVHLTTFHSTSFGLKNQVVLGTLMRGFLILNYNGNWHSILLPHSSGVIRMLMLKIIFLLQRNTNFYKPSIFHGPKTTRPSTRRAPSYLPGLKMIFLKLTSCLLWTIPREMLGAKGPRGSLHSGRIDPFFFSKGGVGVDPDGFCGSISNVLGFFGVHFSPEMHHKIATQFFLGQGPGWAFFQRT